MKKVLKKPAFNELDDEQKTIMGQQLFTVEWLGRTDIDADTAMRSCSPDKGPNKVQACADWLKTFLKYFAYPAKEIEAAAADAGFTRDNVFRAKSSLKKDGLQNHNRGAAWWSGFGPLENWIDRPE